MLIETIIKDGCTYLNPSPEHFLASLDWFNDYADQQTYWPVCLMENVTPSKPIVTAQGVTQVEYSIVLFFLHNYDANDQEGLNHNPQIGSTRHTAVDTMRQCAYDLIQVLFKDSRLTKPSENISNIIVQSVYNFMDMNLDGVQLSFSVKLQTVPSCFPSHAGPLEV